MIIGSISNIVYSVNKYPSSKISCALSTISILIISFIVFNSYILMKQTNPGKKQKADSLLKKANILNTYTLHRTDQLLYFNLLHILIPIFIAAQLYYLFFIIVTCVLAHRFQQFYSNRKLFQSF